MSKRIITVLLILSIILGLSACRRKAEEEGAAADVVVSDNDNGMKEDQTEIEKNDSDQKEEEKEETLKEEQGDDSSKENSPPIAQEEYDYDENTITKLGNESFDAKTGTLTLRGSGKVEYLPKNYYEGVKKIVFCEGITEISYCFRNGSSAETIEFPSSLKKISNSFTSMKNLEALIIPATLEKISFSSFDSCGIKKLKFEGAIEISESFELVKKLEQVLLPEGSVCKSSFRSCFDLQEVILEKNVRLDDFEQYANDDDDPFTANPTVTDYSFSLLSYPKAYVYLPGDGLNHPWGIDGNYSPVIVPEGENWEDYRDVPMTLKSAN